MEYFFCNTHKVARNLRVFGSHQGSPGNQIEYLSADRGFDHWLDVYGGFLPSPKMRWCQADEVIPRNSL